MSTQYITMDFMRLIIPILAAVLLAACAPDDQVFDVRGLTPWHQAIFRAAADDLNNRQPNAVFVISAAGDSTAVYGGTPVGVAAMTYSVKGTTIDPRDGYHWVVVFMPGVVRWTDESLLSLTTHELCHVLRIGHDAGNPDPGHC